MKFWKQANTIPAVIMFGVYADGYDGYQDSCVLSETHSEGFTSYRPDADGWKFDVVLDVQSWYVPDINGRVEVRSAGRPNFPLDFGAGTSSRRGLFEDDTEWTFSGHLTFYPRGIPHPGICAAQCS